MFVECKKHRIVLRGKKEAVSNERGEALPGAGAETHAGRD